MFQHGNGVIKRQPGFFIAFIFPRLPKEKIVHFSIRQSHLSYGPLKLNVSNGEPTEDLVTLFFVLLGYSKPQEHFNKYITVDPFFSLIFPWNVTPIYSQKINLLSDIFLKYLKENAAGKERKYSWTWTQVLSHV